MDQHAAQARVGTTLRGKWRLDRLLGVGGMAAVYAGSHRNGSRGAIKMLHPALSQKVDVRRRFLLEGYAANKVNHPGVVKALDEDEAEDGSTFVVMELLEGESLEERRLGHGGTLPPAEVLVWLDQVLDVLTAAHAVGIVHRDIKPDNLFVCRDGQLKVLDFGIARVQGTGIQGTAPGAGAMGTPAFMAPEQARGEPVDARADLWAVGATAHHLLTGSYVHEATSLPEMFAALCGKQPRSLAEAWPEAPEGLVPVVDRALRLMPAERWPDASTMQAAVREAYQRLTGTLLSSTPVRLSERPPLALAATVPVSSLGTSIAGASSSVAPPMSAARPVRWPLALGALMVLGLGAAGWSWRSSTLRLAEVPNPSAASSSAAPPVLASVPAARPAPATRVRLRSTVACVIQVDGVDAGPAPVEVPVSPGHHRATCAGTTQEFEAVEGETIALHLTPAQAPTASTSRPVSKPVPRRDVMDRRED